MGFISTFFIVCSKPFRAYNRVKVQGRKREQGLRPYNELTLNLSDKRLKMYLKSISLENTEPIDQLKLTLPFTEKGNPKPVIFVGENGTGKSLVLAYIVNCLISTKQQFYEDVEVEKGEVYKTRSSNYIRNGENYYFSRLVFENDLKFIEWQLNQTKGKFEKLYHYCPLHQEWSEMQEYEDSFIANISINQQNFYQLKELIDNSTICFFPPNRFEEPAWLNTQSLKSAAQFSDSQRFSHYSYRKIVNDNNLKNIRNWILDVIFEKHTREIQVHKLTLPVKISNNPHDQFAPIPIHSFAGYDGTNTKIMALVCQLLEYLFDGNNNIKIYLGNKHHRSIGIGKNDDLIIPNLFYLSTGESILFTLFCSILRDYDLTRQPFTSTEDIRGIVIIDEIDLHLHTKLQRNVLPKLLKLFPKVQFIITTHSPLFLLGMRDEFTDDGFTIVEMPKGDIITAERFKEFEEAYTAFKNTEKFNNDLQQEIKNAQKPIVFVEGDYDIRYIRQAAILFNKTHLLDKIELRDGDGFGNLDKIWKNFNDQLASVIPQPILLLYDCDTNKQNNQKQRVYKRVIPSQDSRWIKKGIENLFPDSTIQKAREYKLAFIDHTPEVTRTVRGEQITEPEKYEVNKNEKGNLCNQLCKNGTKEDFQYFEQIFTIIEEFLNDSRD